MRLYYMTTAPYAEKILREQRLKLSTIPELNDPFELTGVSLGDRRGRVIYKKLYAHWVKTTGLLCIGGHWESPVMWAHYGDKHQGVCLGFDLSPEALVKPVSYVSEQIKGLLDHIGDGDLMTEPQLMTVLTTKFKDWEYEREWRLFARLDERTAETDGKYFLNFAPHLTLTEVVLGARCKEGVLAFSKHVIPGNAKVEVIQARAAFDSFRVVRQGRVNQSPSRRSGKSSPLRH